MAEFYWKQYRAELIDRKPETEALTRAGQNRKRQNSRGSGENARRGNRAELKRIASEDITLMYELTKSEAGEEIPPDKTEIERNQAEEQDVKEIRERLQALNEEAWFGDDALQASRATFGISSGGVTGRGLGLGYVELIPVADSDYIYAALGEELGIFGGL